MKALGNTQLKENDTKVILQFWYGAARFLWTVFRAQ
jgi:hypothetical protein